MEKEKDKGPLKAEFGSVRLRKETVGDLKELKEAYEMTYGMKMTYDEFVRKLVACVEDGDVAVWELYCLRRQQKDEALRMARGLQDEKHD